MSIRRTMFLQCQRASCANKVLRHVRAFHFNGAPLPNPKSFGLQPRVQTVSRALATSPACRDTTMPKRHERSLSHEDGLKHPSTKRAKEIDAHPPLDELLEKLKKQKTDLKTQNVLHWFRSKDIRTEDNRALSEASKKAREGSGHLITCFLWSPKDLEWHGTSPARTDFLLESLRILQEQLHNLNIPFVVLMAEKRGDKSSKVLNFIQEQGVSHVYANIEYEVDELRRDIHLVEQLAMRKLETRVQLLHDQTVVEPKTVKTASGTPLKVFTPYHKAWLAKVADEPGLLDLVDMPTANNEAAKTDLNGLFDSTIPTLPPSKQFSSIEDRDRIRKLWPAGHEAGLMRLQEFLRKQVKTYKQNRSIPATDNCSRLSPYFASGIISVREALKAVTDANKGRGFASGDAGIASWVREIVFREFYRQILAITPHDSMNLPHNLKFDFVQWEDDEEGWKKWCEGKTGMPFVDAGMRQLREEAYMHNRLRMNTSSYLRTNLLIDYRKGERFFAETLVDWDLSNNTQGWEPSFTVFNPVIQAEKCDPKGDYIRRWVPELKNVQGKAVFDPYSRLSKKEFAKLGYPAPHVDFKKSKERCMERYKQGMADAGP